MEKKLFKIRKKIFLANSINEFTKELKKVFNKAEKMILSKPAKAYDYVTLLSDIAIDLNSFFTEWKISSILENEGLDHSVIDDLTKNALELIAKYGGKSIYEQTVEDINIYKNSEISKIGKQYNKGEINTVYGHDLAFALDFGLRRGAKFITTNPAKITQFKENYPIQYSKILTEINAENENISSDDFASIIIAKFGIYFASILRPVYELTNKEYGFVCLQVSPKYLDDSEKMTEQADFWWNYIANVLNVPDPNIVFKLPAVPASVETAKELLKKGYRISMTLGFSVTQHEIFGELIKESSKRSFVVQMGGYLDGAVNNELLEVGFDDSEAKLLSQQASEIVVRKSLANLKNKGLLNTSIMVAAVRTPSNIINSIVPFSEQPVVFTTTDKVVIEYDKCARDLTPVYNQPVSEELLNKLNKSPSFRKAYADRDSGEFDFYNLESLLEYPPLKTINDMFVEADNIIRSDAEKYLK
ncbi:MAG: transaldolase family protein [Saccharofermentanales bacterium]